MSKQNIIEPGEKVTIKSFQLKYTNPDDNRVALIGSEANRVDYDSAICYVKEDDGIFKPFGPIVDDGSTLRIYPTNSTYPLLPGWNIYFICNNNEIEIRDNLKVIEYTEVNDIVKYIKLSEDMYDSTIDYYYIDFPVEAKIVAYGNAAITNVGEAIQDMYKHIMKDKKNLKIHEQQISENKDNIDKLIDYTGYTDNFLKTIPEQFNAVNDFIGYDENGESIPSQLEKINNFIGYDEKATESLNDRLVKTETFLDLKEGESSLSDKVAEEINSQLKDGDSEFNFKSIALGDNVSLNNEHIWLKKYNENNGYEENCILRPFSFMLTRNNYKDGDTDYNYTQIEMLNDAISISKRYKGTSSFSAISSTRIITPQLDTTTLNTTTINDLYSNSGNTAHFITKNFEIQSDLKLPIINKDGEKEYFRDYSLSTPLITGYTPVGILGYRFKNNSNENGSGESYMYVYQAFIDNNTLIFRAHANQEVAKIGPLIVEVYILYAKTS